jgi:hypothetical protein
MATTVVTASAIANTRSQTAGVIGAAPNIRLSAGA